MNALPKPLQDALRPFAPRKPADMSHADSSLLLRANWASLLRLPFPVEKQTRPASAHGPAEYRDVYADERDVVAAVDALIDRHIVELEADVKRRMLEREASGIEP